MSRLHRRGSNRATPQSLTYRRTYRSTWKVGLGLLFAFIGWQQWNAYRARSVPSPPAVDLSQATPEVVAAITSRLDNVKKTPSNGRAWGELGEWLFAHQYEYEANVCLEQAAALDRESYRWPYLLGLSLSVSDPDRAIAAFRSALGKRSHWPVAHLRLGELLLAREEIAAALRELQIAHEQGSNEARVCFDLSRLNLMRGDLSAAATWGTKALQSAPDVRSIHELMALLLKRLGKQEVAEAAIQAAESAPIPELGWTDEIAAEVLALRRDVGQQVELAQTLLHSQRFEEAIRILERAIVTDPTEVSVSLLLAQILNRLGRTDQSRELLDRATKLHPQSAELQFQLGVMHFQSGDSAAAKVAFLKTLELKQDHVLAHYNLGHVYLTLNRVPEAETAFESAARINPLFLPAHVNAARLLAKRGELEASQRHLRIASQIAPEHPEVRQLLGEVSGQ